MTARRVPPDIRPMTGRDARAVLELHSAAVHLLAKGTYGQAILEAWAPRQVSDELVAFFQRNPEAETRIVAERDGRIVGFGALVPSANELRACYVDPAAARGGIGRAIVWHLEAISRAAGLRRLQLDASLNAEAFYRSLGFRAVATGTHQLHRSGQEIPMPCVRMEKDL